MTVTDLLIQKLRGIVDIDFTAHMEDDWMNCQKKGLGDV